MGGRCFGLDLQENSTLRVGGMGATKVGVGDGLGCNGRVGAGGPTHERGGG